MVYTATEIAQLVQYLACWLDDRETVVRFLHKQETFHFSRAARPPVMPSYIPIQLVRLALLARVKRPGHKAIHSLPYGAEVKNELPFNVIRQRKRRQNVYCNKNKLCSSFHNLDGMK
jgi:hypothetical protein